MTSKKTMAGLFASTAFASTLVGSQAFASPPEFSAFVANDTMYVTILGDTCNAYGGSLKVTRGHADRMTADYVETAKAELLVRQTRKACKDGTKPHVLELDLNKQRIAREAIFIEISFSGDVITIPLK